MSQSQLLDSIPEQKPKRIRKKVVKPQEQESLASAENPVQLEINEPEPVASSNLTLATENNVLLYESILNQEETELPVSSLCFSDPEPMSLAAIKKRGRKPKGGKIIHNVIPTNAEKEDKPNIILHLKCFMKDLNVEGGFDKANLEPFCFAGKNDLNFNILNSAAAAAATAAETIDDDDEDNKKPESGKKIIWKKLKQLEHNLHINNICDKKSACFWCTYDFDNPPIYIPKYYIKDSYHVYGCFCSPECAVAHLMEENIDTSTKFERYHLLNHIYAKVYNYTKNIKPAANPYYLLDKYYGNLSIQEYRALLQNERFFLIVDKPLTRILPELHEDNEDHIINNKIIPSNNSIQVKKKMQRKQAANTTNVMQSFQSG
jgi:hypothetical protein